MVLLYQSRKTYGMRMIIKSGLVIRRLRTSSYPLLVLMISIAFPIVKPLKLCEMLYKLPMRELMRSNKLELTYLIKSLNSFTRIMVKPLLKCKNDSHILLMFKLEALRALDFNTSSLMTPFTFFFFSSFFSCLSKQLSSYSCSSNFPNKAVRSSVVRLLASLITVTFGFQFLVRHLNTLLVVIALEIGLPSKFK